MGKVGCIVSSAELILGYLGGSVLTFDLDEVVKKIRLNSGFVLQVMIVGSLSVSGHCKLHIYC